MEQRISFEVSADGVSIIVRRGTLQEEIARIPLSDEQSAEMLRRAIEAWERVSDWKKGDKA